MAPIPDAAYLERCRQRAMLAPYRNDDGMLEGCPACEVPINHDDDDGATCPRCERAFTKMEVCR